MTAHSLLVHRCYGFTGWHFGIIANFSLSVLYENLFINQLGALKVPSCLGSRVRAARLNLPWQKSEHAFLGRVSTKEIADEGLRGLGYLAQSNLVSAIFKPLFFNRSPLHVGVLCGCNLGEGMTILNICLFQRYPYPG